MCKDYCLLLVYHYIMHQCILCCQNKVIHGQQPNRPPVENLLELFLGSIINYLQ